jgi:hypothetical protein
MSGINNTILKIRMTPTIWHLSDVAGLSAAQLRFRPEPATWSVSDVLDHLMKVEKALLEAVQDQPPTALT